MKELKISYEQALIIGYEALKAFQYLIREYGYFIAKDDMVFITREGNVKVWISDNPAKNQPAYPHPKLTEQEFI